ncbi:MAG: hypothetical protein AAF823_15540 [Planctomycetota bacterium]
MLRFTRSAAVAAACCIAFAGTVAYANFNGKYDTGGSWKVKFNGGGSASGTFDGSSKIGGQKFNLKSDTNSGCDLDGKGKLDGKAEKGKNEIVGGKFTSDCGLSGKTRFTVQKGNGTLKENRKGDENSKAKLKATGKGGFANNSTATVKARGKS